MPHIPMEIRRWIYGIALAAVPLLVALGILENEIAPLIIALVGAVIAPGLALANMTPDPVMADYEAEAEEHWAEDAEADEAELEADDE
jgi:hypothetical protein